jgi:hypothetical protein
VSRPRLNKPIIGLPLLAGLLAIVWIASAQEVRRIDDAALRNAGKTGEEWLSYGVTPGEMRFSPLKLIDTGNVSRLGLAWTYDVGEGGGPQERAQLKSRLDAIKYSSPGFNDVWILVQRGDAQPSEGHAIDHVGWRSTGPLTKTIDGLRSEGVTVLTEPRPLPLPGGPTINFAYIAGPAGAKIEIVERPGLKPGQ